MSDRDKGLVEALENTFPNNHHCHCVVHIQRNVEKAYGKAAAREVTMIAKSFSTRQVEWIYNELNQLKPKAVDFLRSIKPNTWRSSSWIEDPSLPPRHGITSTVLQLLQIKNNYLKSQLLYLPLTCSTW
jgi:Transposase, Mutator family